MLHKEENVYCKNYFTIQVESKPWTTHFSGMYHCGDLRITWFEDTAEITWPVIVILPPYTENPIPCGLER